MEIQRLSGRKQVGWLRKKGQTYKTKTMILVYHFGWPLNKSEHHQAWYMGTAASTKLHKSAVKRNRMRRRCREAVRTRVQSEQSLPILQLLIIPRAASLNAPYSQIQQDVERFLQHLDDYGSATQD